MFKRSVLAALVFSAVSLAGELSGRFQTDKIDVVTASVVQAEPDVPGSALPNNVVSISILTTDYSASSFCVNAIVALENGEKSGVNKCVDKSPFDKPVIVQFSTGAAKPVRWLRLYIVRMHAEAADQLVNVPRSN